MFRYSALSKQMMLRDLNVHIKLSDPDLYERFYF